MMNIRCLAFDIDGTLSKENNLISDKTKSILMELKDKYHMVLVTGRPYRDLKMFTDTNELEIDSIYLNGSIMCLNDVNLPLIKMEREIVYKLDEFFKKEKISYVAYGVDDTYEINHGVESYSEQFIKSANYKESIVKLTKNYLHPTSIYEVDEEIFKLEINVNNEVVKKQIFDITGINPVSSMGFNLEISSSNKAVGLKKYCKRIGVEENEVLFFGDSENDIPIFNEFENTVLVKNKESDIKTKYIAPSVDEDGVAVFLEKHVK